MVAGNRRFWEAIIEGRIIKLSRAALMGRPDPAC
jgi:hypothetical protein